MHRYVWHRASRARIKKWVVAQLGPKGGKITRVDDDTYLPYKSKNGYYIMVAYNYYYSTHDMSVRYHKSRYGWGQRSLEGGQLNLNNTSDELSDEWLMDYTNPCGTEVLIRPTFLRAWKGDITWKHYLFG